MNISSWIGGLIDGQMDARLGKIGLIVGLWVCAGKILFAGVGNQISADG